MRRWLFFAALCMGVVSLGNGPSAQALSLEIRPLEYRTMLKKGESQKGFIDVTNPMGDSVHLKTEVQAFRQVDDRGSLQFYDSERMAAGIIPDLDEFDLAPGETLRMYFKIDGSKLAAGDNFGALFFRIIPPGSSGVNSSLRLGTLFSIENASTTDHRAEVTKFSVPFFQFSEPVSGSYSITNTADPETTNAFYPQVKLTIAPFAQSKTHTSSLVFAGRTRTNEFRLETVRFGFYAVTLEHNGKTHTRLVFIADTWQLVILGLFTCAFILGGYLVWYRHEAKKRLKKSVK